MSKELEIFKEMERTYLYGNGGDLWLELKAKSELVKQALQDKDKRIKELELSDTSKEESSIKYYNEMRKLLSKLDKIEKIIKTYDFIDNKHTESYQVRQFIKELKLILKENN